MTVLYQVELDQVTLITKFVGQEAFKSEVRVRVSYGDLPWTTAQAYREKFPTNNVVITEQAQVFGEKRKTSVRLNSEERRVVARERAAPKHERMVPKKEKSAFDMTISDAINASIKDI